MAKNLAKNIQVLKATRHEFMARFDFEGVGYIAFSSDWSNAENVDQWTILYNEDDYKTCEHDNTVPTMLYDEYDQDGVRGCRGEISQRLKEAMEEALDIASAKFNEDYLDCVIECEENINRSESLHEVK